MLYSIILTALLDCSCALNETQPTAADLSPRQTRQAIEPSSGVDFARSWVEIDVRMLDRIRGTV